MLLRFIMADTQMKKVDYSGNMEKIYFSVFPINEK